MEQRVSRRLLDLTSYPELENGETSAVALTDNDKTRRPKRSIFLTIGARFDPACTMYIESARPLLRTPIVVQEVPDFPEIHERATNDVLRDPTSDCRFLLLGGRNPWLQDVGVCISSSRTYLPASGRESSSSCSRYRLQPQFSLRKAPLSSCASIIPILLREQLVGKTFYFTWPYYPTPLT
jgi:hypothetical protein